MKDLTLNEALQHRAYLLDILDEIVDGCICYETVRKAEMAIDKIKNQ